MDEPQDTQTTATVETVEPIVPVTNIAPAEDLTGLTDAQLDAHIAEVEAAANAFVDGVAVENFDNAAFEGAFSRVQVARNERSARESRRNQFAAAQARAAELNGGRPAGVPSVAEIEPQRPAGVPDGGRGVTFRMVIPTDSHNLIEGRPQGAEFQSFSEIGRAMDRRADQIGVSFKGRSNKYGLMQIHRIDPDFSVHDGMQAEDADRIIQSARSQKRLPGGNLFASWENTLAARSDGDKRRMSLTAAAGWCAPSETLYDLCEMETTDGLWDTPELTVTRGGVRWTQQPTFADLMSQAAFTGLTEAQVIADTAKACAEIPCPTFTDTRLNVAVTCLTGSFLQLRGYPELMARWGRGAMVAHAHKLNRLKIAAAVTQAGAATVIATPIDDAATSAILNAAELAATDTRYREGLGDSATIEQVWPLWALSAVRADFTRRAFGDPGLTNQRIIDWFAVRNIVPRFVRDWQDFWSGVAAPSFGGTPPYVTGYPATVQFLSYPAGAVVMLRQDVITLHNVYDSTNLQQNLYTDTFFEEGWNLIYPCAGLRLYTASVCPSGATGAPENWGCVANT